MTQLLLFPPRLHAIPNHWGPAWHVMDEDHYYVGGPEFHATREAAESWIDEHPDATREDGDRESLAFCLANDLYHPGAAVRLLRASPLLTTPSAETPFPPKEL